MKAKPIEPGCLVIVIGVYTNPELIGSVRRVLRWDKQFQMWAVSGEDNPGRLKFWIFDEHQLLRIDDPDIQREIESERELEVTK